MNKYFVNVRYETQILKFLNLDSHLSRRVIKSATGWLGQGVILKYSVWHYVLFNDKSIIVNRYVFICCIFFFLLSFSF